MIFNEDEKNNKKVKPKPKCYRRVDYAMLTSIAINEQ